MAYLATEIVVDAFETEVPAGHWSDAVAQAVSRLRSKHPGANVVHSYYRDLGEGVFLVHLDFDVTISAVGETSAEANQARDSEVRRHNFFMPTIILGQTEWIREDDLQDKRERV